MFRIIADIKYIDFNSLIDMVMSSIDAMSKSGLLGSIKLPPFFNANALKAMPDSAKVEILLRAVEAENNQILSMIEQAAAPSIGQVRLKHISLSKGDGTDYLLRTELDVEHIDEARIIDMAGNKFLNSENASEILGEHYEPPFDRESLLNYMKNSDKNERLFYCLKILSVNKEELKHMLEDMTRKRNITLEIGALRFLMPR